MTELTDFFIVRYGGADFQFLFEQFGTNGSEMFSSTENWLCRHVTGYPGYQRFFSRAAGTFVVGRRPTHLRPSRAEAARKTRGSL